MKILNIEENSLAQELGIKPGDRLLKINGKKVLDELDYRFRFSESNLSIELEIDGDRQIVEIDKDYDDLLGVEFEDMKIRSCANDCVFCFVDQNPAGMREGLYFRDGDYRLSYLHGHYITMTNMGWNELQRVVDQRLSPLYISVHVTDPEMRKRLFLYSKDDYLLEKLDYLTKNNIELHTQIVLMPDQNDGEYLLQTIKDLYSFHPILRSVSIVPVGLTGHREGLVQIKGVDKNYAEKMINEFPALRQDFPGADFPFIFLSDEWFIVAEQSFPPLSEYEDADLTENGVGQVQTFLKKFESEKSQIPKELPQPAKFTIVTGTLINNIFRNTVVTFLNSIKNLQVNIYPIVNNFMGTSVTVTGLLTGRDIVNQLKGRDLGQAVWCTNRILNDEGTLTLDDMSLAQMSAELGVPVNVSDDSILEIFERGIIG